MPGSVTLLALTGSGPDEDRQEMSHPHHVVELEGAALIVDLGADRIWRIDLPSNDIATFTDVLAGSGPRHAVITPAGLAVSGELDATIMIAGVTSAPSSRFAAPTRIYPSDILWHPAGYIVMANRNADSLAVFSPSLELVHEISAGGAWPLNLALLSDHQIAVANRDSDVVAMFSLSSDGTLTREATHTIPRPTWVLALDPSRSANSPSSFQEEK
jgi:6-phosphogluconolactonase (cycloisomerase 2 family)